LDWEWDWSLIENFALQHMYKEEICLDIGCGNGWFLIRVAKRGIKYGIGIDPSKTVIKDALVLKNSTDDKLDFIVAVGENLPLREEAVDAIVLLAVLDHVLSLTKVINEAHRVLKHNGRLIIYQSFSWHKHPLYSILWRLFRMFMRIPNATPTHTHSFSFKELNSLLINNFRIEKFKTYGLLIPILSPQLVYRLAKGLSDKFPLLSRAILGAWRKVTISKMYEKGISQADNLEVVK
jgi:ubiquinone/menaquinone biosynthesis C-methylase UbiE